jgi:hypothetical protein
VDITGRLLQELDVKASSDKIQFVAPDLAAGIYLLQIQNGDESTTMRLVKDR